MSSQVKDILREYVEAEGGEDGLFGTPMPSLCIMRSSTETLPRHMVYRPSLCFVVQGAKQIMLGDDVLRYEEQQSLVIGIELPGIGRVVQASRNEPYIGITLELDVAVLRDVMRKMPRRPRPANRSRLGIFVQDADEQLTDCMVRLIRLARTPKAIPVLYPAIMQEICFWLLNGEHGGDICKLTLPDSHMQRIADAIFILREDFAKPIRVNELAAAANMSPSSFHEHFKLITSMSPLQYQKHLRLIEARRLLVSEAASVAEAAHQVGYESASQFSREYNRMFGAPPRRDASELRSTAPAYSLQAIALSA
ncbi:AraC family transcriptional regulator [Neorhizobium sp. P12A]|uniref:AraC family transcriptional regulator n=1 Tax=Neorhizobium sp. P12A TaxID=2268027 RepID=UPI0011EC3EA0|nr:AraC family transcriptional regulator [Neorhizobium sp. P12A]KAA0700408.1 AraC family transcriptional regulator [Neorhizobium sp. P12A]